VSRAGWCPIAQRLDAVEPDPYQGFPFSVEDAQQAPLDARFADDEQRSLTRSGAYLTSQRTLRKVLSERDPTMKRGSPGWSVVPGLPASERPIAFDLQSETTAVPPQPPVECVEVPPEDPVQRRRRNGAIRGENLSNAPHRDSTDHLELI
jgi:hypothetical protein